MSVDLAVVVVTYNSAGVIAGLLDSLAPALSGLDADVVVVDNGSTDGTVDLLETRADCRVVRSENRGYSAGINLGVRHADDASAILVLNPDVRLDPAAVRMLLGGLKHPRVGIVAPLTREPDGNLDHSLRREPSLLRSLGLARTGYAVFTENLNRPAEYESARLVDWAVGAALLISHECFDAVSGWDESYFLYSEEIEFCLRARDLGFVTRFEPQAIVIHKGGESGRDSRTYSMQVVNRVRLYRRRHGVIASWAFLAISAAREALRSGREDGDVHKAALIALLRPTDRPSEIGCSDRLMPS